MARAALFIAGIIAAALGGVVAYRAAFLAPAAAVVITEAGEVSEVPNVWKIAAGTVLLVAGVIAAFVAASRRPRA